MIKTAVKNGLRLLVLLMLQVLILDNINLGGYINPYLYILFVLSLPIETPRWLTLFLGLIAGFMIDVFTRTPGMHMSAGVFLGFIRPIVLQYMAPRDGYEFGTSASMNELGAAWYVTYASILTVLHHLFLFFAEAFTLEGFFGTAAKALLSAAVTWVLIMIVQLFVIPRKKVRL